MKIRTDFVTNSSSSSFTLMISLQLKDGESVEFEAEGGGWGEDGPSEFFRTDAIVSVSPKKLGTAPSVDELISLLEHGVYDSDHESKRYVFTGDTGNSNIDYEESDLSWEEYVESLQDGVSDASVFIDEIRQKIHSMDDISVIEITGNELNDTNYKRTYRYSRLTGEYTGVVVGEPFEKDGYSGGDLELNDLKDCKIQYIQEDEEYE